DAARAEQRCLVTENVRDFTVLVRHTSHAGVLLVHARRWPRTRAGLPLLADALHRTISEGRLPRPGEISWLA
ncbi:MAG TPA: hypothetical protein VFO16_22710, partial [Pseudonocardiaceae bacterium]|nr:hypothetical protein [Pseudonocardiaceae bacterium]